jgi:hypothetical protein
MTQSGVRTRTDSGVEKSDENQSEDKEWFGRIKDEGRTTENQRNKEKQQNIA